MLSLERADSASYYKQYAYIELNYNIEQFDCLNALYHHESRWSPTAKNGSHYGIPQMRNKKLKNLDGYTQIDWGIRYNKARYSGDFCLAWAHFKSKGWH